MQSFYHYATQFLQSSEPLEIEKLSGIVRSNMYSSHLKVAFTSKASASGCAKKWITYGYYGLVGPPAVLSFSLLIDFLSLDRGRLLYGQQAIQELRPWQDWFARCHGDGIFTSR